MLRKVTKGKVMNICFWSQVGFRKKAEAVSGKRKKNFSNREIYWETIKLKNIVSHSWI